MFAASLVGYMSGEVAGRDVDHDDDDDDEKGQWNRSIASLRSESRGGISGIIYAVDFGGGGDVQRGAVCTRHARGVWGHALSGNLEI